MIALNQYGEGLKAALQDNAAVKKLYLFGSALTVRFDENNSDIDMLVETQDISPEEKGEHLIVLWEDLERLFNRKIDLLTENSLRNPYLEREIVKTRKLIYDGQTKQIFI
jgi:predicted nucleotidyltransferase